MRIDESSPGLRTIVTPEGVALPFELATLGTRAMAFLVDAAIVYLVVVLIFLALVFGAIGTAGLGGDGFAFVGVGLVGAFLLRTFYWSFFEIRWGGATPGKRLFKVCVISRDGGPVTSEAIFARNLTRELEVFLPLTMLSHPEAAGGGLPPWAAAIAGLWVLGLGLLPFLGRDRLRAGDLLGGTLVVQMPVAVLEPDLAAARAPGRGSAGQAYPFTSAQLDLYGIKELHVLEELLRKNEADRDRRLVAEVAKRIRKKIGWPRTERVDDWRFLNDFYKAQRGRLEGKLLMGKRQEQKRS
ncbi:MAG: RDD family protein [Planctomycetes bacterium]|nr:RDD family protein [Planctomycetota bacterium]